MRAWLMRFWRSVRVKLRLRLSKGTQTVQTSAVPDEAVQGGAALSCSSDDSLTLSTCAVMPEGAKSLGVVFGSCVLSTSIIGDTAATLKNITVGGELKQYTRLLDFSMKTAVERLKAQAVALKADGVFAMQFVAPQVAGGAAEIIAIGTAYSIKNKICSK